MIVRGILISGLFTAIIGCGQDETTPPAFGLPGKGDTHTASESGSFDVTFDLQKGSHTTRQATFSCPNKQECTVDVRCFIDVLAPDPASRYKYSWSMNEYKNLHAADAWSYGGNFTLVVRHQQALELQLEVTDLGANLSLPIRVRAWWNGKSTSEPTEIESQPVAEQVRCDPWAEQNACSPLSVCETAAETDGDTIESNDGVCVPCPKGYQDSDKDYECESETPFYKAEWDDTCDSGDCRLGDNTCVNNGGSCGLGVWCQDGACKLTLPGEG